jgi:mono/diheme cytochrome c family protein
MKRVLKGIALVLVLAIAGLAIFIATFKPKQRPASTEVIDRTPARLARGKYLFESALGCGDCHAPRDITRYGGPVTGPPQGGLCWGPAEGMPGRVCASNITPDPETGIGAWSDGELLRALREGVDRTGRGLFPLMPYTEYRTLSDEDARAVVVYLRGLPPVKNAVAKPEVKFPVSFFIKMAPKPLDGPVAEPDPKDRVGYGAYLARVGGCQLCHTPVDERHVPLPGQQFSGGQEFKFPGGGAVRSANITPHATGLGDRDEKAFVGLFKAFALPAADLPVVPPQANTVMPWLARANMTEEDLAAIYGYLKTVPAIERVVEKRPPPALPPRPDGAPR